MAKNKQKPKIDEKDKKFIVSLISVLLILGVAVILVGVLGIGGSETSEAPENKNECPQGSQNVDVCTQEYSPVCGYDSQSNQVDTFANDCHACKESNVSYYIEGECK